MNKTNSNELELVDKNVARTNGFGSIFLYQKDTYNTALKNCMQREVYMKLGAVHTTLEEFENGGLPLKTHKMFSVKFLWFEQRSRKARFS